MINFFDSFGAVKILVVAECCCAVYDTNPAAVEERVEAVMEQ